LPQCAHSIRSSGSSLGYGDVKRFADKPMQTMLAPMVEEGTLLLARRDFLVLVVHPV